MIHYTDDPVRDAERYQMDLEKEQPKYYCDECGEEITKPYCFNVDGSRLCEACMLYLFKEWL